MATKIKKGSTKENYLPNNNPMSGVFDIPGMGGFHMDPGGLGGFSGNGTGKTSPLSEPWEMIYSNSYFMLSMLRTVLSYAYVIHGPLRTVVDLPVYDAFRGGIKIHTDEVGPEEIEDLQRTMKKLKLIRKAIDAMRWSRLYGGGALIVNTDSDFRTPLKIDSISEKSKLGFIVADRWQLNWVGMPLAPKSHFIYSPGSCNEQNILGADIDQSRVCRVLGEEAPAIIRQRLQGWSMSVIECIIREINLYFKENNALFELIDEQKISVWKLDGFNAGILSGKATAAVRMRLAIANFMKSFMGAITLDVKDEFEQKQLSLAGVGEVMKQNQIGIAAACRMPVSKLFGLSATGFASGEDDIEVYNSIVEHVRGFAEDALQTPIEICMQKCWGFVPDDWYIEWNALRVMSAMVEETVKTQKFARHSSLYTQGIYDPQEYCEALKEDKLLTIETKVAKGAEPEPQMGGMEDEMETGEAAGKSKPSAGKKPTKAKE